MFDDAMSAFPVLLGVCRECRNMSPMSRTDNSENPTLQLIFYIYN